jgi:hypothetical protein
MVEQDRRRYSDQEGSDDRDRLVCMKLKVAEIAEKLTGASNSFGSGLNTVEQGTRVSKRVGVAQICQVDEVGSVQEGSYKAKGSKCVGSERLTIKYRRRYSDQEGSDNRDRLVCMKLKVAEIAEKLTGASNMNKQSLTMANVVGKELEGSEHCQSFHWQ